MQRAAHFLADSLSHYRTLVGLAEQTYVYANAMQTGHRRIPVRGAIDGKPVNFHWIHLVEFYEIELEEFEAQIALIKQGELDLPARPGFKSSAR